MYGISSGWQRKGGGRFRCYTPGDVFYFYGVTVQGSYNVNDNYGRKVN